MASQCRVRRWRSNSSASASTKLPVSMPPRRTPSASARLSQWDRRGLKVASGSKPATTSRQSPAAGASRPPSTLSDMPLLPATGPPSALSRRQRYSSPRKRLATRSGSTADMRPIIEKPGSSRKPKVWVMGGFHEAMST